jgi:hypothetical protein
MGSPARRGSGAGAGAANDYSASPHGVVSRRAAARSPSPARRRVVTHTPQSQLPPPPPPAAARGPGCCSRRRLLLLAALVASVAAAAVVALLRRPFQDARCFVCPTTPRRLPRDTRVLIAVNSFCGNEEHRARSRATWVPRATPLGMSVKFFVGRSPQCDAAAVEAEAARHGDVVVLPLHESYDRLTLKTHALLAHAGGGGEGRVDLLLKVDDDIYVDPAAFAARLWQLDADGVLARGVYGGFFHNATIVIRSGVNKWRDGGFPMRNYPPYASGAAYFLSGPALAYLARAGREGALNTAWHNEDASVGSWLFGTSFDRYHDEGVLRCLDCGTNVFHQAPWAVHVADNRLWGLEAKQSPAPAHLVEARRTILNEAWGVIHDRVVRGQLIRGECCADDDGGIAGGGGSSWRRRAATPWAAAAISDDASDGGDSQQSAGDAAGAVAAEAAAVASSSSATRAGAAAAPLSGSAEPVDASINIDSAAAVAGSPGSPGAEQVAGIDGAHHRHHQHQQPPQHDV